MNIWNVENIFYQYSDVSRISKLLFHYELYKKIIKLNGDIVECGVFKGSSFIRFLTYTKLFEGKKEKFMALTYLENFPLQIDWRIKNLQIDTTKI